MKYSESDKSHFVRNGNTRFAIKRPTELQLIRHTFIKCYNQTRNNIIVLVKLEGAAYMTWLNECKGTRHLHGRRGVEAGAGGDSRWREEHRKGNTRVSWFAFKCIIEYTSIRWTAAVANRCLKTLAVDGMDGRARPAGRKGAEWRAGLQDQKWTKESSWRYCLKEERTRSVAEVDETIINHIWLKQCKTNLNY